MYRPVPLHTDPVTSYINQYRPILTQYHQVPTSTTFYWPSTIKHRPVPPGTDPVPSYQTPNMDLTCDVSFYKNDMSKYSNGRLSFVDLRWAQLYVSLVCLVLPGINEVRQKYPNFIRGNPWKLGQTSLVQQKISKVKHYFGGFWASKLHEFFLIWSIIPQEILSKKNWNPNPSQPLQSLDLPK